MTLGTQAVDRRDLQTPLHFQFTIEHKGTRRQQMTTTNRGMVAYWMAANSIPGPVYRETKQGANPLQTEHRMEMVSRATISPRTQTLGSLAIRSSYNDNGRNISPGVQTFRTCSSLGDVCRCAPARSSKGKRTRRIGRSLLSRMSTSALPR